jgi:D,D-heptose 1,7-bisphosphate phosphatase
MNKAVFLDRDGVINKEADIEKRMHFSQLEFFPFVENAIKALKQKEYLVAIITNRTEVARNLMTEQEVKEVMDKLIKKFNIDAYYYCPHHPEQHLEGRPGYRIECNCRKPKIGMFLQAKKDLNIDLSKSWMIGDSTYDILAGKNAGCKTILVKTGKAGKDEKYKINPDFIAENLEEAVKVIT